MKFVPGFFSGAPFHTPGGTIFSPAQVLDDKPLRNVIYLYRMAARCRLRPDD